MSSSKVDIVGKAMALVIARDPFFARLLIGKIKKNNDVPLAATDMEFIYYNEEAVKRYKVDEICGVLIHEVLHINFLHGFRLKDRNPRLWNVACDYAINLLVKDAGYQLPEGGLYDEQYKGMTAEQIYRKLLDDMGGKIPEVYVMDLMKPAIGEDEASQKAKQEIASAKSIAKMAGKMEGSGSLAKELLLQQLEPVVNWDSFLRQLLMTVTTRDDYTYKYRNRRYMQSNFYVPSLYSENLGRVLIAVDSSGSVNQKELNRGATEINNFKLQYKTDMEVVFCDTEIVSKQMFSKEEPVKLECRGGGGTDFAPVMKYINEDQDKPVCLIYFTDGYCSSFGDDPDIPVLWLLYNEYKDFKPPFGEVMFIEK